LQILPRRYEGAEVTLGWSDQGDERYARAGWGDGRWSLGVAGREADDSETPDDTLLPSHFQQWSASIQRRWDPSDDLAVDLLVLPSVSRDIGKPNTRFPGRITQYPVEDHLVARLRARHRDGWSLEGFVHPNTLETENLGASSSSLVENESFDFGFTGQGELTLASGWTTLFGLEYFGRQGVRADERFEDFESGEEERTRTLDGSEHELSVFATGRRGVGRATFELGARATGLQQANSGAPTTDDTSGSVFAGVTMPVPGGIELVANVGTGIRFPGLSERFFTGTTGRGEVFANEDLDPERSLGLDVGVRFYGQRTYLAAYLFRNEIDDYIEQVELEPGVETFVNLTSGTIEGAEIEGSFRVSSRWTLGWTGTTAEGRSGDDDPLADVSADRVAGRVAFAQGPWISRLRLEHRFAKTDPGPSEQETPSAELLSASVGRDLARGFSLRLYGTNLLDETYLPAADDLAVPAQGRSVGVAVGWKS
jgi:iron complex outermembrane receptor protein